jgi:hypothetical protein
MQFSELKAKFKNIECNELRDDTDDYFEAVVMNNKVKEVNNTLKEFFGVPVWPSKNKLTQEIEDVIGEFGGIMAGQTLFFRNEGHNIVFAMLWPWQDGEHTTVKMVQR